MADPRAAGARRSGGRPPRRTPVDPARDAAYEVLSRVRSEDAYANLLLPAELRRRSLDGRDAAFATELVSGTIRRQGTYDAILDACTDRNPDPAVRDALRLGAHQLLSMRVPTHAAVSTTVDLVRGRIGQGPAGFANAVLRRVAEHPLPDWIRRVAPDDDAGFRVIAHSHPRWVVDALTEAVGEAEIDALLEADNAPPKVTLVARPGLASVAELPGTPTGLSPYAVVLESGDPGAIAAVAEGRAGVQDEGSQLVALALANADVEGNDTLWLDFCAGPGGKAALLDALATSRGARLLANERLEHRARLVRGGVRQGWVITGDGTKPPWPLRTFDRVLVDAPCSGLGALRRRPESRWRRQPEDLNELVPLQKDLIARALDSVRPGGVVGYATCSPVIAETAGVVEAMIDCNPNVRLEDARALFPTTDHDGPLPGTVQLWPHRHSTDAMFFALLRRVS
ncbi:MAG TPA: transcription antitermination factor NusB [Nocardioidaceae bacterium]|nr:transcription antitermination factor NusB [Nocardioidaceae bacterium]